MYKVLCDGTLMCDSRIEELALINPVVKLEENKAGSFSFIIPPNHPFCDSVQRRKTIIEVYRDDEAEPVFSGICAEADGDFNKQKKVTCEGDFTFLNDSIQRPFKYQGYTVRGLLEAFIENHNVQVEEAKHFKVGIVTVADSNNYITCYTNMESTMQCLKEDLVDDLGGIIRVRHKNGIRYIDYLKESPNTNSQVIKFGKNLLDFTANFSTNDIATAIIPLGAKLEESAVEGLETRLTISSVNNGIDYVHSAEAVEEYGWIYKTIEFDDVTTPEALKSKGEKYLAETQFESMVINAKAIDLHLTDKAIESFKISDQIRVQSNPHGLNKYFRLTKQTLNLNNPEKDTVTLGKNEKISLSAKSIQISEEIKKAVESIVPPNVVLNQAIANATALITNAMGGYVVKTNDELLIMDTDNIETATKVWRWNINGLGYSSSGYNGEYALAMTMDGRFVADAITVEGLEVGKNVRMGENAKISWVQISDAPENLATTDRIPTDNSQLKNGAGYETANSIKETVITKDYIETLNIKAGSVDAENITGETISGINFHVGGENNQNGVITIYNASGVAVGYVDADGMSVWSDNLKDGALMKEGYSWYYLDELLCGSVGATRLTANNETFYGTMVKTHGDVIAFVRSDGKAMMLLNPNHLDIGGYAELMQIAGDVRFFGNIYANKGIKIAGQMTADAVACNKMSIQGGDVQEVEWVWNAGMQRYMLCAVSDTVAQYYAYLSGAATTDMGITNPTITESATNGGAFLENPQIEAYNDAICMIATVEAEQGNSAPEYAMTTPNLPTSGLSNVLIECIEGHITYTGGSSTAYLVVYGISSSGATMELYNAAMITDAVTYPTSITLGVSAYEYIAIKIRRVTSAGSSALYARSYDGIKNVLFY